jgi:hypothetical protein
MMDDEEDVPEVEDEIEEQEEGVAEAYARLNALLRSYDLETVQWSNELSEELSDLTKQNLINRVNVHDADAEIFQVLGSIDHAKDRSDDFNFRDELLNPNKLDNDLIALMSTVDIAKSTSTSRMQKLKSAFSRVKNAQKMVVDKTTKRIRIESGVTKVEARVEELKEQVADLRNALQEKKETIQRNNRDKSLSADELRRKYESEMEDRIRSLVASVEQKNKDLAAFTATNDKLGGRTQNMHNELGKLLQDLEKEERAGAADTSAVSTDPLHRFRASMYRHANTKGAAHFVDVSAGVITKELVGDSQKALETAFARQQELYSQMAETEEKTIRMRRELTSLLQSEEHKALERLKKVCDNLQVKIQSDEQRVKVMAGLVQQMQKGEAKAEHQPRIRKTVMDLAKNSKDKPAADGNLRTRARKHPASVADNGLDEEEEVMPLVRDFGDKETISMKLHRRLYAQYFTAVPRDSGHEGKNDEDDGSPTRRQNKPSADLPRKRRITLAQSAKIQKIIDMFNMQQTKLTSVGSDEIQHIFDYREFEEEAERPESTLSFLGDTPAMTPGVSSRQLATSAPTSQPADSRFGDTTQMLPQRAGPVASVLETHAKQNAALIPNAVQNAKQAGMHSAHSGSEQHSTAASITDPYAHLHIPTTAALEDQNEADFYAQNYGMKLALEHLNAFLEILTNGRSSDATFLSANGRKNMTTSEPQEMHTVEGLRASIQKLVELIREMHFMSKNSKAIRKGLQDEVDAKLKACDRLRNDLLHEVEGSHWPTSMRAGQYELEIEACEQNVRELKKTAKQWDQRIGLKRAQNIRLSQSIAQASARRAVTMFKSATEEFQRRHQEKLQAAAKPAPAAAPGEAKPGDPALSAPEPEKPPTPLELANRQIEDRYSVANKRMTLFDDIASIYDTTMSNLKKLERTGAERGGAPGTDSAPSAAADTGTEKAGETSAVFAHAALVAESGPGTVKYDGCEEDQHSDGWEQLQT